MTGDERHDILGAKENNLASMEDLIGFENREELVQEQTDQIVMTTTEILGVTGNH